MEKNEKSPMFCVLALITTPKLAEKAEHMFKEGALPLQYRIWAEGTASSDIMDMLGLGSTDKNLLISILPKPFADKMLQKLKTELKLGSVNSGIAFTIALTGANNLILHILERFNENDIISEKGKDYGSIMENKNALIVSVVNKGFSTEVMNSAKACGATGGTVINSRRIANEEIASFWGLSVQDEKEIVLIISDNESKVEIMTSISHNCGIHSEAKGIIFSLPVEAVMGI